VHSQGFLAVSTDVEDRLNQRRRGLIVFDHPCLLPIRNEIVNLGAIGTVNLGALHRQIASPSSFQPDAPTVRYELSLEKLTGLSGTVLPRSQDEVDAFAAARRGAA